MKRRTAVTASIAAAQNKPSSRTRPALRRPTNARKPRIHSLSGRFPPVACGFTADAPRNRHASDRRAGLILAEAGPLGVRALLHADVAAIGPEALVRLHAGELHHSRLEFGIVDEVLAPDDH